MAADLVVRVPDDVSTEVAAQLICNPVTVLQLRRIAVGIITVGYQGVVINNSAASSVGRLVTADALRRGIDTISVVRSASRAQQLCAEFPDVPMVSTDSTGWSDRLVTVASERPIAVVLDPIQLVQNVLHVGFDGTRDITARMAMGVDDVCSRGRGRNTVFVRWPVEPGGPAVEESTHQRVVDPEIPIEIHSCDGAIALQPNPKIADRVLSRQR